MNNALKNTRIEFHILQSFPVTCLNRDDVGAPKTAVVGSVTRARVSSQCWKRQVRLALQEFGVKLGIRTKKVAELVTEHCIKLGAAQEPAQLCASKIAELLADDTLLFISDSEAEAFAGYAKEQQFDASKIKDKELAKLAKKKPQPSPGCARYRSLWSHGRQGSRHECRSSRLFQPRHLNPQGGQ